mgnify:CR=1 FL=1
MEVVCLADNSTFARCAARPPLRALDAPPVSQGSGSDLDRAVKWKEAEADGSESERGKIAALGFQIAFGTGCRIRYLFNGSCVSITRCENRLSGIKRGGAGFSNETPHCLAPLPTPKSREHSQTWAFLTSHRQEFRGSLANPFMAGSSTRPVSEL